MRSITRSHHRSVLPFLVALYLPAWTAVTGANPVWPGEEWEQRGTHAVGLVEARVEAFVHSVQGDGCIVKDGYLVRTWGNFTRQRDWASAAKPVLSTLLMLAVAEERLPGVDALVSAAGWKLEGKDRTMTFRHLANMVSGYGRAELPGEAWAYNDTAINLYALSLKRIFGMTLDQALTQRLAPLQFQDGHFFGKQRELRVAASPRDFARLGWLWMHRGNWRGLQIVPRKLFDECFRVGVHEYLPRTSAVGTDYLRVKSYGGGSDQTAHGPGVYGLNLWFNERVPGTRRRVWPSLPHDAYQANGLWNRHTVTVIPSWGMVVAVRRGVLGKFEPGTPDSVTDRTLALLRPSNRALISGPSKR